MFAGSPHASHPVSSSSPHFRSHSHTMTRLCLESFPETRQSPGGRKGKGRRGRTPRQQTFLVTRFLHSMNLYKRFPLLVSKSMHACITSLIIKRDSPAVLSAVLPDARLDHEHFYFSSTRSRHRIRRRKALTFESIIHCPRDMDQPRVAIVARTNSAAALCTP